MEEAAEAPHLSETNQKRIEKALRSWMRPLYGFALQKTGRMQEAEELASRMVEGLCVSLLRTGLPECMDAYVWRLAQNHWARWLRDRSRKPEGESFDETWHSSGGPEKPESPEALLEQKETIGLLRREIAWLSQTQRQIVIRHYYESQPVAQIAQALDLPPGTVKWHLSAARQELRKGMETMRSVGELGIRPIRLNYSGLCGKPGTRDLGEFLGKRLNQNIVYACYHKDLTLDEIAAELGVSPVFLEDEVASLADFGILERLKAGRFRAQICIDEVRAEMIKPATALLDKYSPLIAEAWAPAILDRQAAFENLGLSYPDQDWNTLAWSLLLWGMMDGLAQEEEAGSSWEHFSIDRPDGGSYIIRSGMNHPIPPGTDLGYLDQKYAMNGDMWHEDVHVAATGRRISWNFWRMDTWWDGRKFEGWQTMERNSQLVVRHLAGELSPEFNLDEYRLLLDHGLLRKRDGGFDLNMVLVPDARRAEQLQALMPRWNPEVSALVKEFNQAWLEFILPTFPKHQRPVARALHQNQAAKGQMRAHILEYLLDQGRIKQVRPEHRPGMGMILWLRE